MRWLLLHSTCCQTRHDAALEVNTAISNGTVTITPAAMIVPYGVCGRLTQPGF
jgi:hypothetical protein